MGKGGKSVKEIPYLPKPKGDSDRRFYHIVKDALVNGAFWHTHRRICMLGGILGKCRSSVVLFPRFSVSFKEV
jgi:hypothetical protein